MLESTHPVKKRPVKEQNWWFTATLWQKKIFFEASFSADENKT